jgi:hypothetical protein
MAESDLDGQSSKNFTYEFHNSYYGIRMTLVVRVFVGEAPPVPTEPPTTLMPMTTMANNSEEAENGAGSDALNMTNTDKNHTSVADTASESDYMVLPLALVAIFVILLSVCLMAYCRKRRAVPSAREGTNATSAASLTTTPNVPATSDVRMSEVQLDDAGSSHVDLDDQSSHVDLDAMSSVVSTSVVDSEITVSSVSQATPNA